MCSARNAACAAILKHFSGLPDWPHMERLFRDKSMQKTKSLSKLSQQFERTWWLHRYVLLACARRRVQLLKTDPWRICCLQASERELPHNLNSCPWWSGVQIYKFLWFFYLIFTKMRGLWLKAMFLGEKLKTHNTDDPWTTEQVLWFVKFTSGIFEKAHKLAV